MNKKPNIKIYSTPGCSYCSTVKEFLKEKNIEFEDIDISKKSEKFQDELIKKSGQISVPIVEINSAVIVNFDREKLCKLLNITL